MLQALAAARASRPVWWLHGARNGREHPFAQEARALLAQLPNAQAHVFYSRPRPQDLQGRDYETHGRLTADAVTALRPPAGSEAYVCGPSAFMDDMQAGLAGLATVHTEPFGPAPSITPGIAATPARPPHPPDGPPGTGPTVSFARSDLTIPWSAGHRTLLELAEACDVPVRWSCRTGVCHTCETTLIAGAVDYAPDPLEPPAEGSVLLCCGRPSADVVLDL
jgi:ferredoxin-NADP reductase